MYSSEISTNRLLQWSLGALVFAYYIVFSGWQASSATSVDAVQSLSYICPPYWQACEGFYFLEALPFGYSQNIFYMGIFVVLIWSVYLFSQKAWAAAQLSLIPLFLWHAGNILFFTDFRAGNYEYYLLIFGFILLFLPHKEFFLKVSLVWFYVLSTLAKIHPSWIEGSYFTALRTGLPLSPDWSIPLVTNAVIVLEMLVSWFLLSSKKGLQRIAFYLFFIFHIYSGILVGFRYPATVLPFLCILFGPWYRYTPVPLTKKSLYGWSLLLLLLCAQLSPKLISGDEKMTLEGNKYGLYMFEANHQCFSTLTLTFDDARPGESYTTTNANARNRCDPYQTWFRIKNICEQDAPVKSVAWQFAHSINGEAFYQIVDEPNACLLTYKAFSHNDWIKLPGEAPAVGYPVKNFYD